VAKPLRHLLAGPGCEAASPPPPRHH
jgi:hypothetical protein